MANFINHPKKPADKVKSSSLLFKVSKDFRETFTQRAQDRGLSLVDYLAHILREDIAKDGAVRKKAGMRDNKKGPGQAGGTGAPGCAGAPADEVGPIGLAPPAGGGKAGMRDRAWGLPAGGAHERDCAKTARLWASYCGSGFSETDAEAMLALADIAGIKQDGRDCAKTARLWTDYCGSGFSETDAEAMLALADIAGIRRQALEGGPGAPGAQAPCRHAEAAGEPGGTGEPASEGSGQQRLPHAAGRCMGPGPGGPP